jgi:hypothetical protein
MQKLFHRLTLGSLLGSLGSTLVGAFDPTLLNPHTASLVAAGGLVLGLVSHLFHANAAEQAVIDTATGIANKAAGK